jgi:mannitol/fructose-specific phosphotransferase system IIA component (Ntr-type)
MTISELLTPAAVRVPLLAADKDSALVEMTEHLVRAHGLSERRDEILASLLAREKIMTTGIGRGVAIPHAELDQPVRPCAAVGISHSGIDFDAPDGKPVSILFVIAIGKDVPRERIEVLSILSRVFRKEIVRQEVREAKSPEALLAIFAREEEIIRAAARAGASLF